VTREHVSDIWKCMW